MDRPTQCIRKGLTVCIENAGERMSPDQDMVNQVLRVNEEHRRARTTIAGYREPLVRIQAWS